MSLDDKESTPGPTTGVAGGKTLWHGRFEEGPDDALMAFTESLSFDKRLADDDIAGSRGHATMLERAGIINAAELDAILAGLDQVQSELRAETFVFVPSDEDIHTAVERRLTEIAGAPGAKLHSGRSRNDQVATDLRLWVRREGAALGASLVQLHKTLVDRAAEVGPAYLPGYTHLQRAQPVPLAHHLLAHSWAIERDIDRLGDALRRADVSPLGAGALAGSSLPLDPQFSAEVLGFAAPFNNSLDAVSDRDFVAELMFVCTLAMVHLSRLGEELILWSSDEFGFITLDDRFSTGSSMLPQKKNPDIAELARGKAGRLIGNLTGILATLKGLPLAYNRDLQEDKEPLFDSVDQLRRAAIAMNGMLATIQFRIDVMAAAVDDSFAGAVDIAEELVARGMPFRDAHAVVGRVVRQALESKTTLAEAVRSDPELGADFAALIRPGAGVARRITAGGAGTDVVATQLAKAQGRSAELHRSWL